MKTDGFSPDKPQKTMDKQIMRCPTCKKEIVWKENPFRPFCSERCRMIDLGNWAAEDYRIPGEKIDAEQDAGEEKNNETAG